MNHLSDDRDDAPPYEQFGETMSAKDNIQLIPPGSGNANVTAVGGSATTPMASKNLALGPRSHNVVCPYCSSGIRTRVSFTTTTRTHRLAGTFGCILCCCLPYCMESSRNTDHYCPNQACGRYLGTYEK